jgi:hypothetical protein
MIDYLDAIPDGWFIDNDGQANVLDPETVGRLVMTAQTVLKQWEKVQINHQPMIESLVGLREALTPHRS